VKLKEMCDVRKAYKRQRVAALQIRDCVSLIMDSLYFVSQIFQEAMYHRVFPETLRQPENNSLSDRALVIMCMLGAFKSCLEINMWIRAIEVLASFWYWDEENPNTKRPAGPKSLLGIGESGRLWGSILVSISFHYLTSIRPQLYLH
jgi:hypothetical protein